MSKLKKCPCGKTPTSLGTTDNGRGSKWAYVFGSCCGEWMVEFRTGYEFAESAKYIAYSIEAWNEAPREVK